MYLLKLLKKHGYACLHVIYIVRVCCHCVTDHQCYSVPDDKLGLVRERADVHEDDIADRFVRAKWEFHSVCLV
jgi:hypothetical protein